MTEPNWENYANFSRHEFACKGGNHCVCGGLAEMDAQFMALLQQLRDICKFGLTITSGFRCPTWNDMESSTGTTGPHTTGKAVDIAVDRGRAYELMGLAWGVGFTGFGFSQKGGGRFLHLDTLTAAEAAPGPRPTVWSY